MRKRNFPFIESILLMLLIAPPGSQSAAGQSVTDTVFQIQDVVVSAPRSRHYGNDIKADVFTQDELRPFGGVSLGNFLMFRTALNVKAYGAGGAATTISLRGTSPGQVQVNWNGFPINSVTLGSCDISMIPAAGFNRISVVYGAPGALYGSGTFGGAVNLDSDLKPGKALNGTANVGYNSLKTITGSASFHIGNDKFAWKINTWGSSSDNEFTYYDYIRQSRREQTDGAWSDAGIIQHAVLKLGSSTIEAGLWYQFRSYNIPSRMGSTSYESQNDSTLKFFTAYKKTSRRWGLQLKAAIFNDRQAYFQKTSELSSVYSIESHINSRQYYGDADFRYFINPYLSVDAGITGTYITAYVPSYGETKNEKGLTAFTGIKYSDNRLYWQAQLRKEWNSNFQSGILPSVGISWKVIPDKWTLRANLSQKFRKPTFNDLYWIPGGNTDLEPEKGYSLEAGSIFIIWMNERMKVSTDIGLYWLEIKDMIVWRPSTSFWVAENYKHVNTAGMDAKALFEIKNERWNYHSSFMLTLNHPVVKTGSGNQQVMLYSPPVITSWENKISTGIFDFTLWYHFTADRYYDDDSLLDSYHLFNVQAGVNIPVWKGELGFHVTVNNLTNTTYELIRLYPMPGHYLSVKMNYTF
ncbi:MAG: TonB-dependent receptor [Bacteroidales bacterium]|nr:TonB-dependent receptor [Bacteroidales bacterium]